MDKLKNLTGQRFGKLLVLYQIKKRSKSNHIIFMCRCDCGNLKGVRGYSLLYGATKSCGCLWKESIIKANLKHGDTEKGNEPRLYRTWANMKRRCLNPNHNRYKYYGEKGIAICEEWTNNYSAFKFWALLNGYQDNLTIDRINHKGNYKPSNCQWLTNSENLKKANRDRRKY